MHSETLRACGITVESVLVSEREYYLARARRGEKRLVVEITPAGAGYIHSWPSSTHLIPPVEARNLPGELRLLVFDTGTARFLVEEMHEKPFNPGEASSILERTAETLAGLHASGLIMGYAGPENLLRESGGRVLVLAGRRGVPPTPFTPPETVGRRPSDPRSDVFCLGTLFLRLLAGGDDRDVLVQTWNRLEPPALKNLSAMLEQDPLRRPAGVIQAAREMLPRSAAPSQAPIPVQPGFRRELASPRRRPRAVPYRKLLIVCAAAAVAATALIILRPWASRPSTGEQEPAVDFRTVLPDTVPEQQQDTVPAASEVTADPLEDSAVIWVSNGTGIEGRETLFRAGPASSYSFVYPARGTTRRRTSLVLVRRESTGTPLSRSVFLPSAMRFASQDSGMTVKPTDITILLGTDLYHPGINQTGLGTPSQPAETLFVDIANHGIQYTLEGMGAASWMASKLDGKAVTLNGIQYLLMVSDVRDGDRQSDEIGIPAVLDRTIFMYRPDSQRGAQFEELLRNVFQALPSAVQGPPAGVPVPDIHVLLGTP